MRVFNNTSLFCLLICVFCLMNTNFVHGEQNKEKTATTTLKHNNIRRTSTARSTNQKNNNKQINKNKQIITKNNHTNTTSLCDVIHPEKLPDGCACTEPAPYSLVIECEKTFNSTHFNDTIGIKIDLNPCDDDGSKLSLDITEKDHNIDYPITGIRAGEAKNIPIPGLSIWIPKLGSVGVDAAVFIGGNPDHLTLKVGLNACIVVLDHHNVCASSIPGLNSILPFYVLSGTYSFGNICNTTSATAYNMTTKSEMNSVLLAPGRFNKDNVTTTTME